MGWLTTLKLCRLPGRVGPGYAGTHGHLGPWSEADKWRLFDTLQHAGFQLGIWWTHADAALAEERQVLRQVDFAGNNTNNCPTNKAVGYRFGELIRVLRLRVPEGWQELLPGWA